MPILTNSGGGTGGGIGGAAGQSARPQVPQPPVGGASGGFVGAQSRGYQQPAQGPAQGPVQGPPSMPVFGPPSMPVTAAVRSGVHGALGSAAYTSNPYAAPYSQAQNFTSSIYGPQFDALATQQGIATGSIPMIGGQFDAQRRYAQGDYASGLAMNDLSGRGIGISRDDLGTQRDRVGLDMAGRNVDRGYIGTMQGLADRTLANQLAGVDANLASDIRDRNWEYEGRGSWFTPARTLRNEDSRTAAERQRVDLNTGRESQQAGWNRDLAGLGIADQRSHLDYRDLGSAERRLDLEAERLGIERADLERIFQQGMEQLGYDQSMSYMDLVGQLNSGNAQQAQLAAQQLQDIWMWGGMFSQDPAWAQALGNSMAGAQGRVAGR